MAENYANVQNLQEGIQQMNMVAPGSPQSPESTPRYSDFASQKINESQGFLTPEEFKMLLADVFKKHFPLYYSKTYILPKVMNQLMDLNTSILNSFDTRDRVLQDRLKPLIGNLIDLNEEMDYSDLAKQAINACQGPLKPEELQQFLGIGYSKHYVLHFVHKFIAPKLIDQVEDLKTQIATSQDTLDKLLRKRLEKLVKNLKEQMESHVAPKRGR